MILHPSVLQLAKRLRFFLPVPGIIALAAYLPTLSHGVYPGLSAKFVAAAAGVIPPSYVANPLFAWVARAVAAGDALALPGRLNLFSALCGTLSAVLLYHLVSRTILFSACEDAGGGGKNALAGDAEAAHGDSEMPPEVALYNRRVLPIAVAGGLFAAFLFTFTVPVWCAATRLDSGLFDLLLALVALALFPVIKSPARLPRLALSVFVFVLGLFESAVFLLLLPCYAFFTFRAFLRSRQRVAFSCGVVAAGAAGAALSVYAFFLNAEGLADAALRRVLVSYAHALPFHHYHELRAFFPHTGWALVLVQTGVPAIILLFGQQLLFKEKRVNTLMAALLVTLAAVPGLLNLSISPFVLFQNVGHLPVFGSAILAAAVGSVVSACMIFIGPDDRPQDNELAIKAELKAQRILQGLRGCMRWLLPALVLLGLATPWRALREADARRGLFADRIAREFLAAMKERTWLISNGCLDHHLLVQAFMLNKPLTLVTLRPQPLPQEVARLKRLIAADPIFEGQNRQRLQNALSIGTVRFVREWLTADPTAGSHTMVFATPDLWTACGYRPVPEGLAFGGARPDQTLDLTRLDEENRRLSERITPLLAKPDGTTGDQVAALGEALRMKAGFAANELGVLLEESGAFEPAFQAYSRAGQIDPMNVSAAINAYTLAGTQKLYPETLDKLRKKVLAATGDRSYSAQNLTGVLQNYGTIRQQAYYLQQAATWSNSGTRSVASDKLRKAFALSEKAGASSLVEDALVYVQTEDTDKAEECYLAALEKDPANRDALAGISTLMLIRRDTAAAEKWIRKALAAGVGNEAVLYQTITLAILKKEPAQALALLKEATASHPEDLRFWVLQAEVLLDQGDTQVVEHTVLPEMQKALKNPNHFLVHAVRGFLLRKKGPAHFLPARLSLLRALSLNAALPDIWNAVLELDLALNNPEFIETDARNLLNVDPDHALANYLMGSLLLARGALREAEDFLRRSIEKRPTAAAYNDLGEALRLQTRLAEAEAFARQALGLDPGLLPALDTLACILFDLGRYEESAQTAAKAVAARPSHAPYQLTLLRAQIKQGDKDGVEQRQKMLAEAKVPIPAALLREMKAMK